MKYTLNLVYFKDRSVNGNFGDELSKFITQKLINNDKYKLVYNRKSEFNLLCIGSYLHEAQENYYIFGSGVRTAENIEKGHKYKKLKVYAVRGPLTRDWLKKKGINVPEIYGDPALLLPKYFKPTILKNLKNKIGLVPHKSNFLKYLNINDDRFFLINPTDKWENVINQICSCRSIISSSLHGLICADAYNIPNLWIEEYPLQEGDFKFKDYFKSQNREYVKIKSIKDYNDSLLWKGGNSLNLEKLISVFPFSK